MIEKEKEFYEKHLSVLKGGQVIDTAAIVEDDFGYSEVYSVLLIKAPDGSIYQVEVLRDPEGNGPGFLDIHKRGEGNDS